MSIDFKTLFGKYPNAAREDLIPILQDVQEQIGYLSEESIVEVGQYLELPTSKIYGLATFYNQFVLEPRGKYHIELCDGTACHIEKSKHILTEFEKQLNINNGEITHDQLFSIQTVPCLGACGLAPVININGDFIPGVAIDNVKEIIENCLNLED